jgi:UrcA family protein
MRRDSPRPRSPALNSKGDTKMTHLFSRLGMSALLSVSPVLAAAAVAGPQDAPPEVPRVTVQFADLDISHTTGAAVLLTRIKSASAEVCGSAAEVREPRRFGAVLDCQKASVHEAVGRINAPLLTALANHEARVGQLASR